VHAAGAPPGLTYGADVHQFSPPDFDPFEYDDRGRSGTTRRWFSHWNGLIGRPAEEVALGWSDGRATVLVATSGGGYDRAAARYCLAHLALGGTDLGLAPPDLPPGSTPDLMRGIAEGDELWSGDAEKEELEHDLFVGWYGRRPDVTVFVVANRRSDHRPAIRRVTDWSSYDVDGSKPFPLSLLNR
jgi:hypothetical protein